MTCYGLDRKKNLVDAADLSYGCELGIRQMATKLRTLEGLRDLEAEE